MDISPLDLLFAIPINLLLLPLTLALISIVLSLIFLAVFMFVYPWYIIHQVHWMHESVGWEEVVVGWLLGLNWMTVGIRFFGITWTDLLILLANLVLDIWDFLTEYLAIDWTWVANVIEDSTERARRMRERLEREQELRERLVRDQLGWRG